MQKKKKPQLRKSLKKYIAAVLLQEVACAQVIMADNVKAAGSDRAERFVFSYFY